jgi:hypothetical protein
MGGAILVLLLLTVVGSVLATWLLPLVAAGLYGPLAAHWLDGLAGLGDECCRCHRLCGGDDVGSAARQEMIGGRDAPQGGRLTGA